MFQVDGLIVAESTAASLSRRIRKTPRNDPVCYFWLLVYVVSTDSDYIYFWNFLRTATPPAQRVQFILGEDVNNGDGNHQPPHESHPLFSEMEELVRDGDEIEWKETARWVKFEEDVEEGGDRWSKPHVATLSLHSLFELRNLLLTGSVMLDMEANNLETVADLVTENMTNSGLLAADVKEKVKEALLRRHRHQHEKESKKSRAESNIGRLPIIRSLTEIGKNHSSAKCEFVDYFFFICLSHVYPNSSLLWLRQSSHILYVLELLTSLCNLTSLVSPFMCTHFQCYHLSYSFFLLTQSSQSSLTHRIIL